MTSRSCTSLLLVLSLFPALAPVFLRAQGTDLGTIRGTVTDSSGALIPNATVDLTDEATDTVFHYTTNARGDYEAAALQSGRYRATITAPGFGASEVKRIVLTGTSSVSANAVLRAASDTTVQVSSQAFEINTENQTISNTLTPVEVIELPRDSRDIYQFLFLDPNITEGADGQSFKFLGGQSYGASFSVDGQRANGGIFGQATSSEPSLESVGELTVLSNSFSAEYAGVANIRVNTKRGGDHPHGSLFYNNENSGLSAWTLQDKATLFGFAPTVFKPTYGKPRFNITDAGGSFGGPVPRLGKTWFFLAYEHHWAVSPTAITNVSNLAHPSLWGGDFSRVNDASKPAVPGDISLTPAEIATDTVGGLGQQFITIPQRLLNPVTAKFIANAFPSIGLGAPINAVTGRIPSYSTSLNGSNGQHLGDLRIDHDFNEANRIYGVYHASAQKVAGSPVAAPFTGLGLIQDDRLNNTVSLSYTHVFSPRLINEGRGGFNKQSFYRHSNTTVQGFLQNIGFSPADIAAYGAVVGPEELLRYGNPRINLAGFATIGYGGRNSDRVLNQNLITFGDTLTWSLGRHTLKLGGDFVRNQAVDGFAAGRGNPYGTLAYNRARNAPVATPFAAFLLGEAPTTVSYNGLPRPAMDVFNWENGYYLQDDFRVSSRITFNLGLRYDTLGPYTEANDLLANFDPNYSNPTTGQVGRFIVPSKRTVPFLSPGLQNFGVALASDVGLGRGLVHPDRTDFGPRVGTAIRLTEKDVVRGGFGLYYPTSSAHIYRDAIATNPFSEPVTARNQPGGAPISGWPSGAGGATGVAPVQGGTVSGFGNTPSANYIPSDLKNPRVYQWNATYEHQLPQQTTTRISYIGATETGQILGIDLTTIRPSDNAFGTTTGDGVTPCDPSSGDCAYSAADRARIPFPALADYVIGFKNFGHSVTTSFQGQVERQANHFSFSVAYTFLDQRSSGVDNGNDSLGGNAYNPFDENSDYTTDSYVSRHRVVAYGVYDLPFGHGQRFGAASPRLIDLLAGGWQTSFNMFAKTGIGITPFWQCDNCDPVLPGNVGSGAISAAGDFSGATFRPLIIGDPKKNVPRGFQYNPAAFALPNVGADLFSNPLTARRNSLIGPSVYGVNLGLHKDFHLNDHMGIQLGADVNNIFNHPMLSPDSSTAEDSYGRLGDFNIQVDQTKPQSGQQPRVLPISTDLTSGNFSLNPDFGHLNQSYPQEGITSNRQIRLRGRFTF